MSSQENDHTPVPATDESRGLAGVPLTALTRLLPTFRQQLQAAEYRTQQALDEAENLRKIVQGLEGLADARARQQLPLFVKSADRSDEGPRGQEAVRQVMARAPDEIWSTAAITSEILRRGWIDPAAKVPGAAVRAATQRLATAGFAVKVANGRFRLTERGKRGADD